MGCGGSFRKRSSCNAPHSISRHHALRYPATLMFYSNAAADTSRLRGRPNFYMSTRQQALQAFATFKSLALLHSSSSGGGGDGGH